MAVSREGEIFSLEIPMVDEEEAPLAKVIVEACAGRILVRVIEPVENTSRMLDPIIADCLLADCQPKSLLGLEMAAVVARHQMLIIRTRMPKANFNTGNLFKNVCLMIGEALASAYWRMILDTDGDLELVQKICGKQEPTRDE